MNAHAKMFPLRAGSAAAAAPPLIPDLKTVCCICQFVIREGVEPVSHGYCKPCADAERQAMGLPRRDA